MSFQQCITEAPESKSHNVHKCPNHVTLPAPVPSIVLPLHTFIATAMELITQAIVDTDKQPNNNGCRAENLLKAHHCKQQRGIITTDFWKLLLY
jgi:hypothetical protein